VSTGPWNCHACTVNIAVLGNGSVPQRDANHKAGKPRIDLYQCGFVPQFNIQAFERCVPISATA
jgi:hypothetical protein